MQGTAAWVLGNSYTDEEVSRIRSSGALGFNYLGRVDTYETLIAKTGQQLKDEYLVETTTTVSEVTHKRGLYAWDNITSGAEAAWVYVSVEGPQGSTGTAAGVGTPTATAQSIAYGQPAAARASVSGPDTAKVFSFEFDIPKGQDGAHTVSVSATGTSTNKVKYITIDGTESKMGMDVINNVTSTSTESALSAYMGKALNDRVDNIESIGRYLEVWNCVTGLPVSDPPTGLPYTYKNGDYYIIGNVASGYTHSINASGSTTSLGTYSGNYTFAFTLTSASVSSQLTTIESVVPAMGDTTRYTATGTLTTSDATYTITSVIKWLQNGVYYIALCNANEEKLALVSASTTQTDTVTGGSTNYMPNGSSYTGVASTTAYSGTEEVTADMEWRYNGTSWHLRGGTGGGKVADVKIVDTSIVSSKIATIPLADSSTLGVVKGSSTYKFGVNSDGEPNAITMSASDYVSAQSNAFMSKGTNENVLTTEALRIDGTSQTISSANQATARNAIGAVGLELYDSTATPEENILYYVIED